ncbi:phosphate ABC transporter ATP-binding protein [Brevibacillus sp. LEMMJ03]|uniref:ABC transporter ATP-binding protein n=1 Tax=Brevibacillus sp. LEMMJ03 TaxID=2595056 RepID=UPI00117E492B|nr:phosphate ABC transporter ATP-binding protein [Brevibacillus sp. LEMMJ03]TRY27397.1 phosphate ABC transporter ATP-binding protein [Brevibacillus sp. LEMMJ03]
MNILELRDLVVRHEGKTILRVDSVRFEQGKIYGIIGPSGAGKSTLLRVINLLERPAQGSMHVFGTDVDLAALTHAKGLPIQRQMGFVAQKPAMFHASVFDNVAMGLRYRGVDRAAIRPRVLAALKLVDLEHAAGQRADTLSGGEAQRIALARALVYEPPLLLLDEPTASLDPHNIAIFERVIQTIHQTRRTTILIVTHNLAQARRLTHACLFIQQGRIVECGETAAVFSGAACRELQDFISGRMIC